MAQLTAADLKRLPSIYESPRNVGDVLLGEDNARPLVEASASGDDTVLQSLLSQPGWTKIMLETQHAIYDIYEPADGPKPQQVYARPISNFERCLTTSGLNGHAAVVSTLLAFAKKQGMSMYEIMPKMTVGRIIQHGHAAVIKALASADPNFVTTGTGHGKLPLYEAAQVRETDVVAVLLEAGADPLHPVGPYYTIGTYNSHILSLAAMADGPRMTELLLDHGVQIPGTAALHTASRHGHLDTMRFLMQRGADVNEVISKWHGWTPLHFAASRGQTEAMKLLVDSGAKEDVEDEEGKTAEQVLSEWNAAKK